MIKKTKVAAYSVHKMNVMGKAKAVLEGRGLDFNYDEKAEQIVIPTRQGKVAYYPLRGEYNHGIIRGYVENPESMIAYIVKCGVVHKEPVVLAKTNPRYANATFDEVVMENPIAVLKAIDFKITDKPLEVEHKIAIIKNYGLAVHRCNELRSGLKKGSKEYLKIQNYTSSIVRELGSLKSKYPFLKKGGSDFSSSLLECFKEDVSETVWRGYVERAHQKMIDNYFGVER